MYIEDWEEERSEIIRRHFVSASIEEIVEELAKKVGASPAREMELTDALEYYRLLKQ